jgi:hypothetical protein
MGFAVALRVAADGGLLKGLAPAVIVGDDEADDSDDVEAALGTSVNEDVLACESTPRVDMPGTYIATIARYGCGTVRSVRGNRITLIAGHRHHGCSPCRTGNKRDIALTRAPSAIASMSI